MTDGKRCAVLGLGIIGSRAAARLSEAGWQVASWNRTPKELPGEAATAGEAVAGARYVSVYLKDAVAVRTVVESLRPVLTESQTLLNHATVDLETTRWLAGVCEGRGCRFIDAPFTGSKVASGAGQLVYYIGGELDEEVSAYLSCTSRKLLPCGGVGSATVVKLATNLISACTVQALAEALAIADRQGVPRELFITAVGENACASTLSGMKLPGMASGDYDTHFSLANMAKDSRYALALADAAELDAPAIWAVSRRLGELADAGLGGLDFSALAKPYLQP
jgi:3-hydroxyisobutyrate dehydrogenase-like beta-hydroxyacid dehydrogenase